MTPHMIEFTVPAVPIAQPRQKHRKVVTKRGREFIQNFVPSDHPVHAFKAIARLIASQHFAGRPPIQSAVRMDTIFVLPRPSRLMWGSRPMPRVPHVGRPDLDNLDKAIRDAMIGIVWREDSQVYAGLSEKWVAAGDEQPHCYVRFSWEE